MMVLAALGGEWRFVGLGWHPWDLQRGQGEDRVRIQVKPSAAAAGGPGELQFHTPELPIFAVGCIVARFDLNAA